MKDQPSELDMSLDGAKLKVVRAQKHLESLKDEIGGYVQSRAYVVSVEQNADGDWGADAVTTKQPDPMLAAIVGDCLNNLRSALDYVMWELAGTYAGRVLIPPPVGDDKCYFPITIKPGSFNRLTKPRVSNRSPYTLADYKIPNSVIDELRAVQPYNARYAPLGLLNSLVNVDKHRLPILVFGYVNRIELTVTRTVIKPGIPPPPPPLDLTPKVETQATLAVTWQDPSMPREPADRTIEDMVKCVADIVPRFDKFVL